MCEGCKRLSTDVAAEHLINRAAITSVETLAHYICGVETDMLYMAWIHIALLFASAAAMKHGARARGPRAANKDRTRRRQSTHPVK